MSTIWGRPAAALLAAVFSAAAPAGTYTVDTQVDSADANVGDGICADSLGDCSLRAAIQEANAAGPNTIVLPAGTFVIPPLQWLTGGTLSGAGDTHVVGDGTGRVLYLGAGLAYEFADLSLSGGRAPDNYIGGGVYVDDDATATFTNVELFDNTAGSDGGAVGCSGTCLFVGSWLHDNHALPPAGSAFSVGGAVAVGGYAGATATFRDSTLEGNSAAVGGAIWAFGNVDIVNSTLSGNHAIEYAANTSPNGQGGAISIGSGSAFTVRLFNATIANNVADRVGGGVHIENGTLILSNSILTTNRKGTQASDCARDGASTASSSGYNIVGTSGCGIAPAAGDKVGVSAGVIEPLADNGGPAPTHALSASSPAIDAGHPSGCLDEMASPIASDQRGVARADGGATGSRCDIGAFEGSVPPGNGAGEDSGSGGGGPMLPGMLWLLAVLRLRRRAGRKQGGPGDV